MWRMFREGRRVVVLGILLVAVAAVVSVALFGRPLVYAQDVTPDMLRALQQRGAGETESGTGTRPTIQTYRPVAPQGRAPASELEDIYSTKAGRPLFQIGYDALGVPATIAVAQAGAVQDDYVLGVGDELVFELRGQENSSYRQRVDRDGRITLPKLNPIPAAGRSLGDFRAALEAEVGRAYVSTKAFVSLGETRQVSVLVTGHVRTPGMRITSAMASPLDAILLSGGITKTGSLRNVRLIRNGTTHVIDLYSVLLRGAPVHLGMLQDGDRIFVAPLGATIAVAGSVRQPGIYELSPGAAATSAEALIGLAGGTLIANAYNITKTMLDRDGTTRLVPISKGAAVRSGEILFVDPSRSADLDRVTLSGAVQLEGARPLSSTRTINELFHSSNELLPSAYALFAVVARRDATTNAMSLVPFSAIRALTHTGDIALQSNDAVYLFTDPEIRALARLVTRKFNEAYSPQATNNAGGNGTGAPEGAGTPNGTAAAPASNAFSPPPSIGASSPVLPPLAGSPTVPTAIGGTSVTGSGASETGVSSDPRLRPSRQGISSETAALAEAQALARAASGGLTPTAVIPAETDDQIVTRISFKLGVPREMLLHVVSDHLVWVLDQVHVPGVYVAADGTTLPEMIEAAGGTSNQADLSAVEVTSTDFDRTAGVSQTTRSSYAATEDNFRTAMVKPLDVIRLRRVYVDRTGESVTVAGEVRYPGIFDITRDERLSSVLQRAGGMTDVAYPYGAIFTRRSAAIHEREGNERSARELQSQLAVLAASPTQNSSSQSNLSFLTDLIEQVRNAPTLGRVMVTADPVILASRPDLDVILEPGDALYIPKRPSSVTVSGEVLNPGSFQFRSSLGYGDYVRMAGGSTQSANEDDTFVVMPDGSASPTEQSWLTYGNGGHIPPGSTIVVPRNLRPFDWGQFLKDATQIISQLAVSAASLAVLRTN